MTVAAPPLTCPRCAVPPLRSHDEVFCLAHGEVYAPIRAWETAPETQVPLEFVAQRRKKAGHVPMPWTKKELHIFETWREGDPVPVDENVRSHYCQQCGMRVNNRWAAAHREKCNG